MSGLCGGGRFDQRLSLKPNVLIRNTVCIRLRLAPWGVPMFLLFLLHQTKGAVHFRSKFRCDAVDLFKCMRAHAFTLSLIGFSINQMLTGKVNMALQIIGNLHKKGRVQPMSNAARFSVFGGLFRTNHVLGLHNLIKPLCCDVAKVNGFFLQRCAVLVRSFCHSRCIVIADLRRKGCYQH